MKVRVLFFSVLRDLAGTDQREVEFRPGDRLDEVLNRLMSDYPALSNWEGRLLLAVNQEFAGPETALSPGDEIALMPPVQGG